MPSLATPRLGRAVVERVRESPRLARRLVSRVVGTNQGPARPSPHLNTLSSLVGETSGAEGRPDGRTNAW